MNKNNIEKGWSKEFDMKWYADFNHLDDNKKICSNDCEKSFTLQEVEDWNKQFISSKLKEEKTFLRINYKGKYFKDERLEIGRILIEELQEWDSANEVTTEEFCRLVDRLNKIL